MYILILLPLPLFHGFGFRLWLGPSVLRLFDRSPSFVLSCLFWCLGFSGFFLCCLLIVCIRVCLRSFVCRLPSIPLRSAHTPTFFISTSACILLAFGLVALTLTLGYVVRQLLHLTLCILILASHTSHLRLLSRIFAFLHISCPHHVCGRIVHPTVPQPPCPASLHLRIFVYSYPIRTDRTGHDSM